MFKIGLLGFGKMGGSIVNGIISSGKYAKSDFLIYSLNKDDVTNAGFTPAIDEKDVYENAETVIFAVKPQTFPDVMDVLEGAKSHPNIVVTIAAGISIRYMQKRLGEDVKVIRLMPNLGASIGMAVSTMAHSANTDEDALAYTKSLFQTIGSVTEVNEKDIITLLPLNGSYPAYIWYFIRSFVRYAEKNGIDPKAARKMLADATLGCAKMLNESPKDLDTLINDVCSYKGTTIEGVYVFDEKKLDEIVEEASVNCADRGRELEIK